jgi:hypothetical protein
MTPEQRHAQLRGPENPRARGHSPARDQREAVAARAAGEGAPGEAPPGDQETPPAAAVKIKVGKFEVSEDEVGELMADKAARDLARTQIPADPKAYKLDLPEGVKLPGDAKITFGTDPDSLAAADAAKAWVYKKGLSQSEFSELLSIQAHSVAAQEMRIATYARAEVDKLGANGPQRIDGQVDHRRDGQPPWSTGSRSRFMVNVNRRSNLTPYRRPILAPLIDRVWR